LLGSRDGTAPGTPLPGGMSTLPLNWDYFTNLVFSLVNSVFFQSFIGPLDSYGSSIATFYSGGPLPSGMVGSYIYFAYALNNPWNYVSNPVAIWIGP